MDDRYISLGLQYFILARLGGSLIFNPVSGNLFHHAFETLIKAYLLLTYTEKELKRKFGHDLPKLWTELKEKTQKNSLNKYDYIIEELHIWEKMRYLGFQDHTSIYGIEIIPGHSPGLEELKLKHENNIYAIYLDDMDELFQALSFTIFRDPNQLKSEPSFQMGIDIYEKNNKYSIFS